MDQRPTALVRRPGPLLADGLVTHIEPSQISLGLAFAQWQTYVSTLENQGWTIAFVDPADDCPDAVFIEDAIVVFDDLAIVTRPGAEARRAETAGAATAAAEQGLYVATIEAPGTVDGGDVMKVDLASQGGARTAYVGLGGRTNEAGIAQLAKLVGPLGWTVVPVPTTRVLHLKSAVTALVDGTVIGFEPLVDNPAAFPNFLAVPEESGAHVVQLGGNRLLIAAGCPQTQAMLTQRGYELSVVDISEFERLEGCVTCLSVRIR